MSAGPLPSYGRGGYNEVTDLKNVVDATAHPENDNGFKIIKVSKAVDDQRSLWRTDSESPMTAVVKL